MSNLPLNPYAAPKSDAAADLSEATGELSRDEIDAYVGPKAPYYRRAWARQLRGRQRLDAGFNTAGLFLNVFWLLYRKMYREFLFLTLPAVVFGIASGLVGLSPATDRTIERALNIGTAVTVATLGNGFYFRRARQAILESRRAEPRIDQRLALLQRRGGTTLVWPLVALVTFFGVTLLSLSAPE